MRRHRFLAHGKEGSKPKLIIIHAMAESIIDDGGWDAVEYLDKIGLSAHSLIYPNGVNVRCRHDNQTAYHAKGYNSDSLGIEFLVPGTHDYGSFIEAIKTPYLSEEQYQSGLYQVREWIRLHDIQEIARHCDKDPYRKVDPGDGFPWEDFLHDLGE
jgi:N-acetyl-anhydromuramyl-L-alanine amidase AmpD